MDGNSVTKALISPPLMSDLNLPSPPTVTLFAAMKLDWLGQPSKVIWCLHDEAYVYDGSVE